MKKANSYLVSLLFILICTAPAIGLVISGINPPTYTTHTNLSLGQYVYMDRTTITFSDVASLGGSAYIRTANDHKVSDGNNNSFLTFSIDQACTVYVAHDSRIAVKPTWLNAFTPLGTNIVTTDTTLQLYAKDFAAGSVALGGNGGASNHSMYSVVIVPLTDPPGAATNPAPADSASNVSLNATLSWTPGTGTTTHNIYFGDSNPPAFAVNQAGTTYKPSGLMADTTYYWRVDTVNIFGTTAGSVWSFTTGQTSAVGYWPLDDNAANAIVVDETVSYDGTFYSGASPRNTALGHSSDRMQGTGSLYFDGIDDYIMLPRAGVLETGNATTKQLMVSAWVKHDSLTPPGTFTTIVGTGDGGWYLGSFPNENRLVFACWLISGSGGQTATVTVDVPIFDGQWHHVTGVFDGSNIRIHVDGHYAEAGTIGGNIRNIYNKAVLIGQNAQESGRYWKGLIDDVNIYDYALSAEAVYNLHHPNHAWQPNPGDDALGVDRNPTLGWVAGNNAVSHDVYFGSDENAVASAQRLAGDINGDGFVDIDDLAVLAAQWLTDPGAVISSADIAFSGKVDLEDFAALGADWHQTSDAVFMGNQVGTSFQPGMLMESKPYYWRVDEVNPAHTDSPWIGRVWSFTTDAPPAPQGTIIVDPDNPTRMVYSQTFDALGRLKPVFFAGPGDPEDLLWNNSQGNTTFLINKGARSTYITAVLVDFGGGNPGTGTALDARLDQWDNYITQLQNAGIITVFFFFDDEAGLNSVPDWQELVDKTVAKLKHHKLLIWSVAEEFAEGLTPAQVSMVAARIKQQDDNNHIVAVHQNNNKDMNSALLADPNIDMFMMQLNNYTPEQLHSQILASNARGTKILNMAEAEDHAKKDRTTVRRMNWASAMAGCSAVQVLWMGRATDPSDWNTQDKFDDCARLTDFMQSTLLNETVNRNDLASGNTKYVLANPGKVYIAYGESGTSLGLNVAAAKYTVKWFDTITGNWVNLGQQTLSAGTQTFNKPGGIGAEAALYLERDPVWSSYAVEAENYTSQTGANTWVTATALLGYSGTAYLRDTRTGTFQTPTSFANYQIDFPEAGTYYCYVRYHSLHTSDPLSGHSNGFHLWFNGVRLSTQTDSYGTREAVYSTKEGAWKWATHWQYGESDVKGPVSFVVNTPGVYTLSIESRDYLFKFDRVAVTNYKVGGDPAGDYDTQTSPAWLESHMNAIPNGYNY